MYANLQLIILPYIIPVATSIENSINLSVRLECNTHGICWSPTGCTDIMQCSYHNYS